MSTMNRQDTERLIQEVLEVYPEDTGKQRAKHLLANDPTIERSNKSIVANKKALPGGRALQSILSDSRHGRSIRHNRSVSGDLPFYRRPCPDLKGTARKCVSV